MKGTGQGRKGNRKSEIVDKENHESNQNFENIEMEEEEAEAEENSLSESEELDDIVLKPLKASGNKGKRRGRVDLKGTGHDGRR